MIKKIGKYLELTKPKVTLLNLLVGVTCFILAAYPTIDYLKLGAFSIIGYLAAGGCGVLNSVYDQDIDRLMLRTSRRAIPSGHIKTNKGLVFGVAMIASSFVASYILFNPLTFLMLALGFVFYLLVYTIWLKRISPWNVVIGGFAGCFAALSGWTAATNTISLVPLLLAALDFLWTPGHLWGLAIKKLKEYKLAGIPMLPVKFGKNKSAKIIFLLNAGTVAFSLLFPVLNLAGTIYLVIASVTGIAFVAQSLWLAAFPSEKGGFRVFLISMPYLACLMIGLIIDKFAFI